MRARSPVMAALLLLAQCCTAELLFQTNIACTSGFDNDLAVEACHSWCPNDPDTNCARCRCRACGVCLELRSPPSPPQPSLPPQPPTPPPGPPFDPPVACTPQTDADIDYEDCFDWCPNDAANNCGRCRCKACGFCRVPIAPPDAPANPPPMMPPSPPSLPPPTLPPPNVACAPATDTDIDYEACFAWCPNDPNGNCGRCRCKACNVCRVPSSPPSTPVATPQLPPPPPPPPSPPPSLPPTPVACAPQTESDTAFETCSAWCTNDLAGNCGRCRCKGCDACRVQPPSTPPPTPASPAVSPPPSPMPAAPPIACPCLTALPTGATIPTYDSNGDLQVRVNGQTFSYPPAYGLSTCDSYDAGLPPLCGTLTAGGEFDPVSNPAFCSSSW